MGQLQREYFERMGHGLIGPESRGACSGKLAYDSASAADRALRCREKRRTNSRHDGAMDCYRCQHCQKWHIGRHHDASARDTIVRRRKSFTPAKQEA